MEVSSKGALEKLFLGSSQACSVCPTIDTSKWKADEKHTITLVVYPDADYIENGSANGSAYNGTSTLFIDDKPAENSTWGQSAKFGAYSTYHYAELRFVWKYLSTATDTEKSITIHSYRVTNKIDGTISRPVFNAGSSGLAESQNKIYSYSGKKVSDITAANSGAKVYSGNTELGADASLAAGQKVVLTNTYDTVSLSTGYILAETDSGTFADTPQSFSDGYPSEKFTHEADFTVKTTVHSFGSNASVRAYLAQYDYEGRLIDVAMSDETAVSNNGSAEVSISFKPKKSAGTTLKFMVWDSDMKPCGSTVEFSPYSAQNPEVIATYKGFTNKAATFRFDDGISADGAVIASLDKFGAKSTFYAVGGWQGNSSHYMGYDASATDKVNWTKFKNAYKDHEVGNHTLEHTPAHLEEGQTSTDSYSNTLTGVSAADLVKAVNDNQTLLYEKTGITTRGIAWPNGLPFGRSDWGTILAGISLTHDYSISTNNATTFDTPKDWYQWQTNAYLPEMTAKTDKFIADDETSKLRLFFVWGHAYEVGSGDSVKISTTDFEANLKKLKDANVYFATNSEIYDYVNAVDDISVKAGTVTNKSNQTLYLIINGKKVTLAPNESHTPSSPLTIACWGDSLTYGQNSTNDATGENSYPAVLERMTGATVFNLGVGGETALTIAARQGVVEFTAGSAFTIPASGSVEIPFTSSTYESGNVGYFPATGTDSGGNVVPRPANSRPGRDGSWSPVTIAGVEGTLTANILYKDGVPRLMSSATFTRLKAGDAVSVSATDKIVSAASSIKADVNVFFTGTNGYQTVSGTNSTDLTSLVKRQIAATKNPEKYIVIGLTSGSTAAWGEQNTAFKTEFGDHFIDAKAYFTSEQALLDAGISADDVTHKENVAIPSNFLATDGVHFNDLGYKLLAGLVYDKLSELGYLND